MKKIATYKKGIRMPAFQQMYKLYAIKEMY